MAVADVVPTATDAGAVEDHTHNKEKWVSARVGLPRGADRHVRATRVVAKIWANASSKVSELPAPKLPPYTCTAYCLNSCMPVIVTDVVLTGPAVVHPPRTQTERERERHDAAK
jgi:hypothetical protein